MAVVNGSNGSVARDMAEQQLPPSMQGEQTAASLVNQNGSNGGWSNEQDGQPISSQEAARKLQDNEDHGAT